MHAGGMPRPISGPDLPGQQGRTLAVLLAAAESLAALAGCILVSLAGGVVLVLLFMSPSYQAEIALTPRTEAPEGAAPVHELLHEIEALDLAKDVEVREDDGRRYLVLTGLSSREFPQERVLDVLVRAGFRGGVFETKRSVDTKELLQKVALPYLSLQAVIFLLAGALLGQVRLGWAPREGRSSYPAAVLLGCGAGLAAFTASMLLAGLLELLGLPVREQEWVLELLSDRAAVLRLAPWIVLIVPVSEEVFFRGYMFRLLARRAGVLTGFLLSSLTFALVHFNPSGFVIYFGIGMALAFIYRRTGNLVAPVAGHVVHNSITLGISLLVRGTW
jgi:membrane protease YdiL (CAAX protease family)